MSLCLHLSLFKDDLFLELHIRPKEHFGKPLFTKGLFQADLIRQDGNIFLCIL